LAEQRVPGVASEDYFKYHVRAYYVNKDAHAAVPNDLTQWNETASYEVTVSGFEGTNVTTEDKVTFANGTSTPAVIVQDIATGKQLFMRGLLTENFICANLAPSDPMYPAATDDPRVINSTIRLDYGATIRDTNSVSFRYPVTDENTSQLVGVGSVVDHFDKETGVLVGRYENTISETENITITVSLQLTNRWAISKTAQIVNPDASGDSGMIEIFGAKIALPIFVGIVVVVLVVLVVVVPWAVLKSRRGRRRRR